MMQILLRFTRAALVAAVAFFASRYIGLDKAAIYIGGATFAFALLSYFFKWAAIASSLLAIWCGAHLVFGVPDARELAAGKSPYNGGKSKAAEAAASTAPASLTARLSDIKTAKEKGLLTEEEYQTIRAKIIAGAA